MIQRITLAAAVALALGGGGARAIEQSTSSTTTYHRAIVDRTGIFYREAGPADAPTVVLLHGYPSSSRQYDSLIPLLADRYHLIAPDYPGFGQSDAAPASRYRYTFDHVAATMSDLLDQIQVQRCILFMQDYGGPVGFRMALQHPDKVQAIVIQNANVYEEGLGAKWKGIAKYWEDPSAHPDVIDNFTSLAAARQRHIGDSPNLDRYNPDTWTDEYTILSRPGERAIQADLLYDYRTNVASYPVWQAWLREHKPPTLVMWGRYDPSFIVPGAQAFRRDVPEAEIHILDAGHFGLDEQTDEIARLTKDFLRRHID
jgi:pimeloyl-ACP methyl ester carboxylesterase